MHHHPVRAHNNIRFLQDALHFDPKDEDLWKNVDCDILVLL